MKLSIKKLAFTALLFSTSTFAFTTQSYVCSSASGGILFGGNAPISEIPNVRLLCESTGGNLVLGSRNNGPVN